jgi:hypothetical protein
MPEPAALQRFAELGIHRLILGAPVTDFDFFRWSLDRLAGLRERTLA